MKILRVEKFNKFKVQSSDKEITQITHKCDFAHIRIKGQKQCRTSSKGDPEFRTP